VPEARRTSVVPEARRTSVVPEARRTSVVPEARGASTEQVRDQVDFRPPSGHAGHLGGDPRDVVEQHRGIVPRITDNRLRQGRLDTARCGGYYE
jgi:hypothetical protein